jgi:hypothetical protein
MYIPAIWLSYTIEDRVALLVENCNCKQTTAEDYSYRDFASLPYKVREAIEALEHFEAD